jgi:hypothetical protein
MEGTDNPQMSIFVSKSEPNKYLPRLPVFVLPDRIARRRFGSLIGGKKEKKKQKKKEKSRTHSELATL